MLFISACRPCQASSSLGTFSDGFYFQAIIGLANSGTFSCSVLVGQPFRKPLQWPVWVMRCWAAGLTDSPCAPGPEKDLGYSWPPRGSRGPGCSCPSSWASPVLSASLGLPAVRETRGREHSHLQIRGPNVRGISPWIMSQHCKWGPQTGHVIAVSSSQ